MHDLIDTIRAAVGAAATTEQKAAGVQACRTIAAALDTEPGKPLVLPGMPTPPATSRVSVDQVLDLMIARLTTIANDRDANPQPPSRPPVALRVPAGARPALPRPPTPRRANPTPKKR
jgi:hypothetical protein